MRQLAFDFYGCPQLEARTRELIAQGDRRRGSKLLVYPPREYFRLEVARERRRSS